MHTMTISHSSNCDSTLASLPQERDLIKTFKIPGKVFLNFLRTLEDHYLQVTRETGK